MQKVVISFLYSNTPVLPSPPEKNSPCWWNPPWPSREDRVRGVTGGDGGGGSAQMGRSCARHRNFPTQHYQWLGPYRGLCSYPAKPPPQVVTPRLLQTRCLICFCFINSGSLNNKIKHKTQVRDQHCKQLYKVCPEGIQSYALKSRDIY